MTAKKKPDVKAAAEIDLDEFDRAEAEKKPGRKGPVVKFKGKSFQLTPEMPLEVVVQAAEMRRLMAAYKGKEQEADAQATGTVVAMMRAMFGPEQWEQFLALGPSISHLGAMFERVFGAYAEVDFPESSASDKS